MIEVRGLSFRYGTDPPAIDDLSFEVAAGEVYCMLGAAGAGKTTLTDLLAGGLKPSGGRASIAGADVRLAPLRARELTTFIRAHAPLYGSMTARQNVLFLVRMGRADRRPTRPDVENALRSVGVPERHFDRRVRDLPQQLRVPLWLAVATLRDTSAIVLDDPLASIDAQSSEDVCDCLDMFRARGKAVLLTTGDLALASRIADRIGILHHGRRIAERLRSELLDQSVTEFLSEYEANPAGSLASEPRHGPTEH